MSPKLTLSRLLLTCAGAALLAAANAPAALAQAQSQDPAADQSADDQQSDLDLIVVTGTSRARRNMDTPFSATVYDAEDLNKFAGSSQADVLRTIPGIKAEGGGGEVAANVFIKGLPSGGQFQFTPLEYDGMPAFSTFGLNSSAFDVYYRNDLGIKQMEFVRGGVSNLFGPGSVAGIINYISKTGSETPEGTAQIEWAERDRFRGDFATSGPLGGKDTNMFYALSGYYRYDKGPLKTGLPTKGFQLRGNLKREFADGSGNFTLYGQWIDDKVQFFLPLPLDGATRHRTLGNDGRVVRTVQTDDAAGLSYPTPDGIFRTPIKDGVMTRGGMIGLSFDKDFGNGWGINGRTRYARYSHQFNLFLDGDGIVNVPETLQGFLSARNLGNLADASFTFTDSGQPVPGNFLLFPNRLLDRNRPADDFTSELNITKEVSAGGFDHSFTLGGFFANAEAKDQDTLTTYLAEFNNRPRLVDLTITDPVSGAATTIALNGLLNAGAGFGNSDHSATRIAGYLADQFENEDFVFDIGFRIEKMQGDFRKEGSRTFLVNPDPSLSADLQNVVFGNGKVTHGTVNDTAWAGAIGVLYKVRGNLNLYANASRGFFFPQLRGVRFNSLGQPASYKAEIIKQGEAGVKYASDLLALTVDGFYDHLGNRQNVDFVNGPNGSVIEEVFVQSTRTYGLEATANVFITGNLHVGGNITLQDAKFTKFEGNPQFVGNEPRRQPSFLANGGIYYDDGRFDFSFFSTFEGNNFANDGNTVKLDSFSVATLDAGVRLPVGPNGESTRLGINVFNIFGSQGITEGSPRQGSAQSGTGAFFVGRPVLPRRISIRATYTF